jgi:hypothetical protein
MSSMESFANASITRAGSAPDSKCTSAASVWVRCLRLSISKAVRRIASVSAF